MVENSEGRQLSSPFEAAEFKVALADFLNTPLSSQVVCSEFPASGIVGRRCRSLGSHAVAVLGATS